jgi:hypothetical protein
MSRPHLLELKVLEKESQHPKKMVADIELDKLILRESAVF